MSKSYKTSESRRKAQKAYYQRQKLKKQQLKETDESIHLRSEATIKAQKKYRENNRDVINMAMSKYNKLERTKKAQILRKSLLFREMTNKLKKIE